MNKWYVYKHIRLDTNEIFYIGIGSIMNYKRAFSKQYRNETCLNISEQLIDGYDLLTLKEKYEDDQLGAFYHIEYFGNEKVDMEMWLCPVMLYVFGQYPERIYLSESC